MRTERLNRLLDALKASIQFEKDGKNLKGYFAVANAVVNPSAPLKECNSCSALMTRYHGDFQRQIWTKIAEEDSRYVPELPSFQTVRYNTPYQHKALRMCSFKDLRLNETNCQNEAKKARAKGNAVEAQKWLNEYESIRAYRLVKHGYFEYFLPELELRMEREKSVESTKSLVEAAIEFAETNEPKKERRERLINKDELIKMKEEGKTHQECADHFNVGKSAISMMLKELGWKRK